MNGKKKLLALMLVLALVIAILPACGNSAEEPTEEPAADPVVIQIGYENNPGEPLDVALNEWKSLLEEESEGTMAIELFPSSQLGAKNDLIDQMIAGDAVMTLADGAFYADRGVKDMGIVFGPYLFDTWEDCWALAESDWWNDQCALLEEKGLKIVASNWMYGDRHTMTVKPVNSVDDLKGMKIRVPNNTIQVKGFEVLGATPTPMPLGDVYTALNQKTIDGLENPLPVLYNGKFQEVAKYLVLDAHVKNFTTWVCGADFFNSLTKEQQDLLVSTGEKAGLYNNDLQVAAEKEVLQNLIDEGVTVKELTEEEKAAFKEASMGFYSDPTVTADWSENLYETVKEAMGK
jgi:tripartite ATP-independent transporter DctP family solute receptor